MSYYFQKSELKYKYQCAKIESWCKNNNCSLLLHARYFMLTKTSDYFQKSELECKYQYAKIESWCKNSNCSPP